VAKTTLQSGGPQNDVDLGEAAAEQRRGDISRLASGWLLSLVGVTSSAVFGFAFSVVIARGLGAEGAGAFFVSTGLIMIAVTVAGLGTQTGIVRMLARFRALGRVDALRTTLALALVPSVGASVALAAVLFASAGPISDALLTGPSGDAAAPYLRAVAPLLPLLVAYDVVIAATRGMGAMLPWVAIHHLGVPVSRVVAGLVVILTGASAGTFAPAWGLPSAVAVVPATWALLVLVRRDERADATVVSKRQLRPLAVEFWRFTIPLAGVLVLQIVLVHVDTIMLAALASPAAAGIYRITSSVVIQGAFASQAVTLVLGPIVSSLLARSENERAQSTFQTATWWITALAWPIYMTLAVFAPVVLSLFGSRFMEGTDALRILALAMLVGTAAGPVSAALLMSGRSSWGLVNTVTALVLNVVLNLILIPPLGMTGAALAWSASIIVSNVAPGIQLWYFTRLRALGSGFWIVACAAVGLYGGLGLLLRALLGENVVGLCASAVISTALYAYVLWRFRDELHLGFLLDTVRRRIGRGDGGGNGPITVPGG
jgi:O-antigen/teichoic acid export membrane protein